MTAEQADGLGRELAEAAARARTLEQDFLPAELATAPSPGAWSAADNLIHLTLSSQALVPRMSRTLAKLADAGRRTEGPSPPDWLGRLYAWVLEPPVRLKARAPRAFVPPGGASAAEAVPAFLAEQERVLLLLKQSVGLDLASRKVPSAVSRYVRHNVCAAFHILAAHQRRHLWQARRAALAVRAAAAGGAA
jgi:hypothetical protein